MTKNERHEIIAAPAVAYFSGFGGLEIKEISYGIEDEVKFVVGAWCGQKEPFCATIKYDNSGAAYFTYRRNKIFFGDCVRC